MSSTQFTKDNAFSSEAHNQFSNLPEVAKDAADDISTEEVVMAVAFSSLLAEIMTPDQREKLTEWERAALDHFVALSDDVGLEEIGAPLRS